MSRYNPDRAPSPEEWLALDEGERIVLAEQYHRRRRIRMPNQTLHAAVHATVENQIAMREPVVVQVFARLQDEGLDRHEAIHALGSVLAEQIFATVKGETGDLPPGAAYHAALQELTAEKWLAG